MIPTSNLAHLLLQTARRFPERPGLIRHGHETTWSTLATHVQSAASGLAAHGIRHGDRILVHSRNSQAMFETMWAAWMLGAIWVPTNFRLTPPEVAYLAQSSGAAAHLFDEAFPDHAQAARAANPNAHLHLNLAADWETLTSHPTPREHPADVDRDHPCWFFYTSGTTGRPKAAMLTHGQMAFVVTNHLCDLMPGTTEHDVSLVVAPLSHGAGIHALAQVAKGAATVLMPGDKLDVPEAWRLIEAHRVSNMFTVPTILTMLTRDPAVDTNDHSSLRHVIYAGAPMYRADQVHALKKLGPVLVQYFGLGEVTGNITVLPPHLHSIEDNPAFPIGSVGYPRTGIDIAILDANNHRQPPNETGEICIRGPAVFAGYHNNPEATEKAFAGGWFHTGDLGHLDTRGYLFITGRASDMYISGGSNVYPKEIEEILLEHPDIAEACVIGIPDERWGETGIAILVMRGPTPPDEPTLRARLSAKLARYKHPQHFVVWPELPKSGYGKVAKREVKRLLLGK